MKLTKAGALLENAVLKSALPARMLAGLSMVHVTGLAILGDVLRHPIAVRRPLLAPADWRGLSIGNYRSGVQEETIRALGATPVVAFGPYRTHDLASGAIQGFELDVQRYVHLGLVASARYVTANVTLWPQFDALFANPARLASLTPPQRGWLQQAAADAARNSVILVAGQNSPYIGQACAMGARSPTATPTAPVRHPPGTGHPGPCVPPLHRVPASPWGHRDLDGRCRCVLGHIRQCF